MTYRAFVLGELRGTDAAARELARLRLRETPLADAEVLALVGAP